MHDFPTKMTAFQNHKITSIRDVPPSLLRKTFQPVVSDSDIGFDPQMLDTFVDDDDFSDHDSHYSEDLADDYQHELLTSGQGPDMTRQLLDFADLVNSDIKKFFGPKKGAEDSCDIYADKWKTIKSGRERYYRDLLRIAEGDNDMSRSAKDDVVFESTQKDVDNRHTFTGRFDKRLGLGPFKELFEHGLKGYFNEKKAKTRESKSVSTLPMQQRRFPESFWKQPEHLTKKCHSAHVINSPKPPDFSDLLETWTMMGDTEFKGDMSSDTSNTSPIPVHHRRV
ncbi:hypothetical protein SNE40_019515 [Patella caerulea]|uniref:Uncharacterized protein n=2 Tax=Patella caerulea TaxID=87958 RepID=A0AAN8J9K4_PATCE